MTTLDERLTEIADVPILLVASDFDGTISPIVSDPAAARPDAEAVAALRTLASREHTTVAVISGRALADLAALSGLDGDVLLVGSHGSEFGPDFRFGLPDEAKRLRRRIASELGRIAAGARGIAVEEKPASVALHYRNAAPEVGRRARAAVERGPAALEGVHTKHGKMVIELCVVSTDKGAALRTIREDCEASAVVFFGDDETDEDAFATLSESDLAVKVGPGESLAPFRLESPEAVAQVLTRLAELRA